MNSAQLSNMLMLASPLLILGFLIALYRDYKKLAWNQGNGVFYFFFVLKIGATAAASVAFIVSIYSKIFALVQ